MIAWHLLSHPICDITDTLSANETTRVLKSFIAGGTTGVESSKLQIRFAPGCHWTHGNLPCSSADLTKRH